MFSHFVAPSQNEFIYFFQCRFYSVDSHQARWDVVRSTRVLGLGRYRAGRLFVLWITLCRSDAEIDENLPWTVQRWVVYKMRLFPSVGKVTVWDNGKRIPIVRYTYCATEQYSMSAKTPKDSSHLWYNTYPSGRGRRGLYSPAVLNSIDPGASRSEFDCVCPSIVR